MAEKTLTKEQWAHIDTVMSGLYGRVELVVDGRNVTLSRERTGKNKLGIIVFIDGSCKGEWLGLANDHPEQRYMHRHKRFVLPAKYRVSELEFIKKFGKKYAAEIGITEEKINKKIIYFWADFPSSNALRRHYEKTFNSIELVEVSSI